MRLHIARVPGHRRYIVVSRFVRRAGSALTLQFDCQRDADWYKLVITCRSPWIKRLTALPPTETIPDSSKIDVPN